MAADDIPLSLQKSIAIIPKVGGALSVIACSAIMRDVSIKWRGKRSVSLTSVVLFCISVADWLYSLFSAFMSTWMVPADSGFFLASGNTASCTAQGFIATLGLGASMSYYAVLIIIYWLMVRPGWTEKRLSKLSIRLAFILPPTIASLVLSIPPLFLGMYNHAGKWTCAIASYPLDCEFNPDVECTRGQNAWVYWDTFWVYCMLCNVVIILFVCLLTITVRKQERKMDKYLTKGQEKRRTNTTKTAWQGIRYVGAFMLAYVTFYAMSYYKHTLQNPPIGLCYVHLILTPMLGLFNSFVYFRPRYIAHREMNPNDTRLECLSNVFNIDLDYLESRRSRMSQRFSSLSRKTIRESLSATIRSGRSTSDSGDSISDADLTSPLFRDDVESRDEEDVE